MIIGVLTISLHIPASNSLKEKRRHLNALRAKLASNFNVSVAEVDERDKWQKAVMAIVHVGITKPVVNSVISHIIAYIEQLNFVNVINYETELIA